MRNLIAVKFLLAILMFIPSCSKYAGGDKDLTVKIDSIFQKWDHKNSPGAAVSVLKDGEIIFKKGYGMANLEYDIPIGPSTIFHIASESKQFTAFCIVLLAQQGKLSLDDDIRKYLPELPDFGSKITIRNLIYHTSGLRDQWQLLAISGTRLDDVITQDHILKLVKNQKRLNFKPGDRRLYCNTGYTLLAEIVKRVSGQSLREFAENEIFKPLGMKDTHFHDNYREIVKNRAYSYDQMDSISFENSVLSYSTVGATSLFTTAEDEAKWLDNYFTARVGGRDAIEQMYEKAILNTGDTLDYAFGLVIDKYNGWKRIHHGGGDAGFRTFAVRFPDKNLGITVFSNLGSFDPYGMAMKIADIFLTDQSVPKDSLQKVDIVRKDKHATIDSLVKDDILPEDSTTATDRKESSIASTQLDKEYFGKYCSEEGLICELIDSTRPYIKFNWGLEEMIPITDSTFRIYGRVILKFNKKLPDSFEVYSNGEKDILRKYEPAVLSKEKKSDYQGTYESNEVNTQYKIMIRGDDLILSHTKYKDVKLAPITDDQFTCPHWWMSNLIFHRDKNGEITGFEINCERVLHLDFKKI
jgi:CubicO group peptidase (beta-lactamase class C family)